MAHKKKKGRTRATRNPADVRAGIDASKIGMGRAAQRTGTQAEIDARKGITSPGGAAQQERLRATRRATGDPTTLAVDERNRRRGFESRTPELRAPAQGAPVQEQAAQFQGPEDIIPAQEPIEAPLTNEARLRLGLPPADVLGTAAPITGDDLAVLGSGGLLKLGTQAVAKKAITSTATTTAAGLEAMLTQYATAGATQAQKSIAQAASGKLTSSIIKETIKLGGGRIQVNTYTAGKTGSWLGKVFKSPAAAGAVLTMVGSYPFAGFIKEEALQTLGFATNQAIENGDIEGAEEAMAQQVEIMNPDGWSQMMAAIPTANILKQIENFVEAAALKMKVDAKKIEKLKTDLGPEGFGLTPIAQAERDEFEANVDARRAQANAEFDARQTGQTQGPPSEADIIAQNEARKKREVEAR